MNALTMTNGPQIDTKPPHSLVIHIHVSGLEKFQQLHFSICHTTSFQKYVHF